MNRLPGCAVWTVAGLMLGSAGCSAPREVQRYEKITVPVPEIRADDVPAQAQDTTLAAELERVRRGETFGEWLFGEVVASETSQALLPPAVVVRRPIVPKVTTFYGAVKTPRGDLVEAMFDLKSTSFDFKIQPAPVDTMDLDTVYTTIVQGVPFLSRLGLVAIGALIVLLGGVIARIRGLF